MNKRLERLGLAWCLAVGLAACSGGGGGDPVALTPTTPDDDGPAAPIDVPEDPGETPAEPGDPEQPSVEPDDPDQPSPDEPGEAPVEPAPPVLSPDEAPDAVPGDDGVTPDEGDAGPTLIDALLNGGPLHAPDQLSVKGAASSVDLRASAIGVEAGGVRLQEWRDGDYRGADANNLDVYVDPSESDILLISDLGDADLIDGALDYSVFGAWAVTGVPTGATLGEPAPLWDAAAFYGGSLTDPDGVPTSGGAFYAGSAAGVLTSAGSYLGMLSGSFEANVDFETATLRGSGLLFDAAGGRWGQIDTGLARINGNVFSGDGASTDTGFAGSIEGGFYGPAAAELAGSVELSDGADEVRVGFGAAKLLF